MKMNTNRILDFKLGGFYRKKDILALDVRSLNNRGMDFLIFENNSKIYFFEKATKSAYRIFDISSQDSHVSVF